MPSVLRFARYVVALALTFYFFMLALVSWVEPHPREIVTVVELHSHTPEVDTERMRTKLAAAPSSGVHSSLYFTLKNLPLGTN
jgi:hypothetical protein